MTAPAHEQTGITRDACWKQNFCQFEQGVLSCLVLYSALHFEHCETLLTCLPGSDPINPASPIQHVGCTL